MGHSMPVPSSGIGIPAGPWPGTGARPPDCPTARCKVVGEMKAVAEGVITTLTSAP